MDNTVIMMYPNEEQYIVLSEQREPKDEYCGGLLLVPSPTLCRQQ